MIYQINKEYLIEESLSIDINNHIKRNAPAYIGGAGLIGAGLAYKLSNLGEDNNSDDKVNNQTTVINQSDEDSSIMNGLKTAAAVGSIGYLGSRIGSNTNNIVKPLIGNEINDIKQKIRNKYTDLNNTKWHYKPEIKIDPKPSTKYSPKQSGFFKKEQPSVITPITPDLNIVPKTKSFSGIRTAPKDKRKFSPKKAK